MTRKIAKTLEEAAQYQFEDSLAISMLKNKAEEDAKEHREIRAELYKMKADVKEILNILKNDDTTNTKGMVEQTRINRDEIEKLKDFKTEFTARFSVIAVIVTIIATFVLNVLKDIFTKN